MDLNRPGARLWRVCALGVFVAALLPASVQAADPAEVLAYDAGDIYLSTPPGAPGVLAVPQGDDPAVSPDGSRLAWSAVAADGRHHVFVGSAAGGGAVQITDGLADDRDPAWSPDGSRLALTRLNRYGVQLALVDADGRNGRVLPTRGRAPTWSPDGRFLAFQRSDGVAVVNPSGGGEILLAAEQGQSSWSPTGTGIAVVSGPVRLVDVATRQVSVVLPDSGVDLPATFYDDVVVGPSGAWLYARHIEVRNGDESSSDIRRYTTDGQPDPEFTPIPLGGDYGGEIRRTLSVGGGTRATPQRTSPPAVSQLTATTAPSRVSLAWTAQRGEQDAGVTVRYAKGSTPPAAVSDGLPGGDTLGSSLQVGRLDPATTYSFSVFTRDWSGAASPAASTTVTTPAQVATTLTLSGPGTITYGQSSPLSGQLVREDTGAPVAGARLSLLGHHTGEADKVLATLTTDSSGRFGTTRATTAASRYTVRYAGGAPVLPASANVLVQVRQRISITFSPSANPPAHTRATLTAVVTPAFPGGRVRVEQHLYEAGVNVLTRFDSRSRVTVRLDTSLRLARASNNVVVTPGARTGYLTDPTLATFTVR